MKKRSRQIFKSTVSFLIIFLMVISSVIQPSSKTKADGFPNDATGVSPDGKYYSAGNKNRLGMVTSDESHTPVELFGFCMANSKKYPGYDAAKDEYFGVYEQMLNLNKESFNKLVRDNHLPGVVSTGHDELWNKVSKLIYIYLKDPTDVIGRSGWATPQDAINEFYTVVQNEIWRYTDGYKVDKDSNQYWFYKYSKQGQKAVYLLREAVDSINVPADFELRGYKPEGVQGQIGYQAIVTGRLKKDQPVGEIKTTVMAGGKTSTENEVATLKAKDIEGGVEVSDKITYKGLYPNEKYDVIGKIYEVKYGELVNPGHPVSVVNSGDDLKADTTGKGEWTLNFGKLNLEAGKSYVVFETVVSMENVIDTDGDGKPDKKQELTHEDPNDKSQTFRILPKEEVENEVVFSKVNIAGKEIAGAKIQIKDEQGQLVKEWISKENQSETFKLKAGTYTFHEEAAPNGYLKVTDITFEVDEQGKVTVKNANGNEVKANGNKLTVTDKAKDQPVGEIKTTVTAGEKTSNENEIATLKAKDIEGGVEVSDKITYKGLYPNEKYDVIGKIYEVKDGELVNPGHPVSVVNSGDDLKADTTGKGEWTLNFGKLNLEAGKSYVVFETVVSMENVIDTDGDGKPDKKQELTHEDPNDKSQTFRILPKEEIENEVVFSKVNIAGKEIAGAKIQIKDEQGQLVKEWISKENQSETFKLKAGTYTFHEEVAPNGYLKVTDIIFEVDEQGKVTIKNANGNEVKANGNKLTVTDKEEASKPENPWTPMIPPTRNLKVTKEWLGTNGNEITAPVDKIEVELYRDGEATGQKLELNKENNWIGEFKNLKVYESIENSKSYEYTVKEVGEDNNSIKLEDKLFKVSYLGNMKDGIKVVNTESPALPPSTPSEKSKKTKLAKTGIETNPSIYSGILVISGGIMLFLKKRNQK
ncbi:thioester-forming surface-anchored protein [Parvimonas sp. G1425]